ncbi:MAG: cell division protein FtsQ [Aestuariivita sp.]|nr:cell division protein FtsQ [Aestuariivita sp.]
MNRNSYTPIDPAPSLWSYRLLRLMLSPYLRRMIFYGVPALLLIGVGALNLSNLERREQVLTTYNEIKMFVTERPEFTVYLMSLKGASDSVMQDIREVMPIEFPVSKFDLDLDHMRQIILGLGPIEQVDVRVRSGGVLQVDVVERVPAFLWRHDNGLEVLDENGIFVRTIASRSQYGDLPLIAGEGADVQVAQAKQLFIASRPLQDRLRGLVYVGERRWDIVLDKGQRLMLPEENPLLALERIIAMDQAEDLLKRSVKAVDLRLINRPTLQLRKGAMGDFREIKLMQLEQIK